MGAPIAAASVGGPWGAALGASLHGLGSLKQTGSFSLPGMIMSGAASAGPNWLGGADRGPSYLKSMWSAERPWLGEMTKAVGSSPAVDYSIAGKLGSMVMTPEGAIGIGLGVMQYVAAKKEEAKEKGLGYTTEDYENDVAEYYEAYKANFEEGFAKGGIASLRKGGRAKYAFGRGPVLSELLEIQEEPPIGEILTETGIPVDEQVKGPGPGIEGISTEGIEGHTASSRMGDLMRLLEEAISQNNTDKANQIRSDLYREFGIRMKKGGRIKKAPGGLMNLGGMEKDYRTSGGFVPIGKKEKADDVPARLSKNEFVMTADAVRAAGGGNINKGAQKMYNTMKQLEGKRA